MQPLTVIANWKMNGSPRLCQEMADWSRSLPEDLAQQLVLCPPAPYLALLSGLPVTLGAQDCSAIAAEEGPYTGEISATHLARLGCKAVILGHSERRQHLSESDYLISQKLLRAEAQGLTPILCIGEDAAHHSAGEQQLWLANQIATSIPWSDPHFIGTSPLMLAYEPIWAIGTGKTASVRYIAEIFSFLETAILQEAQKYGKEDIAKSIKFVYGGSVSVENIPALGALPMLAGVLVGGASLKLSSLHPLMEAVADLPLGTMSS